MTYKLPEKSLRDLQVKLEFLKMKKGEITEEIRQVEEKIMAKERGDEGWMKKE